MRINSFYPVLMSDDVAKSAQFWTTHFSFETTFESGSYVSLRTRQQPWFELAILDAEHPTVPKGFRQKLRHGVILNFEVDDADAEYDRLRSAGLPVHLSLRSEDFGQRHFITQQRHHHKEQNIEADEEQDVDHLERGETNRPPLRAQRGERHGG